jgi:hypothetical protein
MVLGGSSAYNSLEVGGSVWMAYGIIAVMWVSSCILAIANLEIDWRQINWWQKVMLAFIFLVFAPAMLLNSALEIVIEIILGKDDGDYGR